MYLLGRTNVVDQNNLRPTQEQMFSYRLLPNNNSNNNKDTSTTNSNNSKGNNKDKSNPVEIILSLSTKDYYTLFTELLITNPPLYPQDTDIITTINNKYDIIPGEEWNYDTLTKKQQEDLSIGMSTGNYL